MSGRRLAGEAFRFALVGGAATLVHLAAALAIHGAGASIGLANVGGFVTALGFSAVGHHFFTFRAKARLGATALRFVPIALAGFALNATVLAILGRLAGSGYDRLNLIAAVLIVPPATFVAARFFAYAPRRSGDGAPRGGARSADAPPTKAAERSAWRP